MNMYCQICHRPLVTGEDVLCLDCLMHLPRVGGGEHNALWQRMVGQVKFEHAESFCYYQKDDGVAGLIVSAKYHDRPWLNAWLTRQMLNEMPRGTWPYDVDIIVPVPIHWLRAVTRGYNQVSPIVRTLSAEWGIPVVNNCLYRKHYVTSQTRRSGVERVTAEMKSFALRNAARLEGRHVLLVDDVCTTGATLVACADILLGVKGVRVSFMTLAVTL